MGNICDNSVKLRQRRVTPGTSEDKMRRDNSAPHMIENRPVVVPLRTEV
jgi:hypothetical protein